MTNAFIWSVKSNRGEEGERVTGEEGDLGGVLGVEGAGVGKGDGDSSSRLRCLLQSKLSSGGSRGSSPSRLMCCVCSSSCFDFSCLLSLAEGTDG